VHQSVCTEQEKAMRQLQREIQSIQAELKSIRADTKSSARSVSLLEVERSANEQVPYEPLLDASLLDEPLLNASSLYELSLAEFAQAPASSIAPTIVRQPLQNQTHDLEGQPTQKREVECFPIFSQSDTQPSQLAAVIEQLRHHASKGSSTRTGTTSTATKRSGQRSSQSSRQVGQQAGRQAVPAQKVVAIQQLLEQKAQQINELSSQQEAVILELMEISGQFGRNNDHTNTNLKLGNELALECEVAEIPYVERDPNGILILTNRVIDQPRAVNYPLTAKATKNSRQRSRKSNQNGIHLLGRMWRGIWQPVVWVGTSSVNVAEFVLGNTQAKPRRKGYRGSGRRAVASTADMPVTLREVATLVVGAALLRIMLDWVVLSYPMLWLPSILVMITPAAFAIYRSTIKPPTGFAWGYRLAAILIGLLIGGRL
jgi:hypothetical protein